MLVESTVEPKFAMFDSADSNIELVPAVVGKKLRLLSISLTAAAERTTVFFLSGTTPITGALGLADGKLNLSQDFGIAETAVEEALRLESNRAFGGRASGVVTYQEI